MQKKRILKHLSYVLSIVIVFMVMTVCGAQEPRQAKVFGKPGNIRINPYLFKSHSKKHIYGRKNLGSRSYNYSLLHSQPAQKDTLKIIAIRVEFKIDSSTTTTGNGLFGIYNTSLGTREDLVEFNHYAKNQGKAYYYDNLPHDYTYFSQQLEFVRNYFRRISRNRLHIDYEVYPKPPNQDKVYAVPEKLTKYSPGAKRPKESFDEYGYRRTLGLMKFIRDAIRAADNDAESPFRNLIIDSTDNKNIFYEVYPDSSRHKAAILLIHAGASYLTDGGYDGYFGQDTPSDIIDAFISPNWFDYVANADSTIGFDTLGSHIGIAVNKNLSNHMVIDEIMMVSETSNQDSINWGVHGILINQVARQIGIPDLFSTMSGISGIGGFCIMDFAGYSAGKGFIPPLPSAWVRAFMGWDTPVIIQPEKEKTSVNIKALNAASEGDTTILLVPINNHEFYLIENRQRNLSGDSLMFNYDTTENGDTIYISPYDHVNLNKNVRSTFDNERNVIDSVENFDIGIPASGVLIWHIDEYIIRDHLEEGVVNADSSYRGISLEEADGIVDLGVMFQDMFYQAAFDYGGAEDIFPHFRLDSANRYVNHMGAFTMPSTRSNDGGHTYLKLTIDPAGKKPIGSISGKELIPVGGHFVYNYVDSLFTVTIERDTSFVTNLPHWPKQVIPDKFYEPVLCNVFDNGDSLELAVTDTSGRVYVWTAESAKSLYTTRQEALPTILYSFDTLYLDTISYLAKIPQPSSFASCVNSSLYIPSKTGAIFVLSHLDTSSAVWDTINLPAPATSYVCNFNANKWAVGCTNGILAFGEDQSSNINSQTTHSTHAIQALAVVDSTNGIIAAVDNQGLLQVCSETGVLDSMTLGTAKITTVYLPLSLATADLDQDKIIDIVICDRKQGVWLYNFNLSTQKLSLDREWIGWPNDWAGSHRFDTSRSAIPDNESGPAIADLDNDNLLDIIVGGTNGVYAYNHRGVLLVEWPALLDEYFWYQRKSIRASPSLAYGPSGQDPLVIFSSPTGENVTFAVAHIDSANTSTGTIYYTMKDGTVDSASGLSTSLIDSLLVIGDSLVLPYVFPGGYVDAFTHHGKRPEAIVNLPNTGSEIQSTWPFTVGGTVNTSPLLCDLDNNAKTDMITVTEAGMVYRWELASSIISTTFIWPQAGANGSRTFAYSGPITPISLIPNPEIEHFYSYPNPAKDIKSTSFKYRLTRPAQNVRLDIFTYTGYHIFSQKDLPNGFGWNEFPISLEKYGSAVYRCRLEADFSGQKKVKYWKMAVMK